jgi:hypothetical protein
MRYHFWYVLIHIGLGLIGFQYFTWSNLGGIYAAIAAAFVQAYAIFEIHRDAKLKFATALAQEPSHQGREIMQQDYKKRLSKVWFTRTCMYALLTLISAMAARGGS